LALLKDLDKKYKSDNSARLELSFLMIMKGWIYNDNNENQLFSDGIDQKPEIIDEFRFIRKNFNSIWSFIYFLYCIFSFKNPISTCSSFIKTIKIKRKPLFSSFMCNKSIKQNHGLGLIKKEILIRVVIPTYNRYDSLHNVLRDLENQDYKFFSITVIDQSTPFQVNFYDKYDLNIKVIRQEEPKLWRARNKAIIESDETIIALLDDDSRLDQNWITKHLQCLDYYDANISAGVSVSIKGAKVPENYSYYRLADQFDTGNAMLYRKVFKSCGLFDEQFEGMRMGDAEFGLRAYQTGFLSISNPEARRIHLKIDKGGLRQMGSWDGLRPTKIISPRPIPSVLYFSRKYFGTQKSLKYLLVNIPFSLTIYSNKSKKIALLISLIFAIIFSPLLLLQIIWSWRIADKMLKSGPKIPSIE
tara:strand:+ start:2648 stop:3895 length:1248 start_codon:yes stop_codon:yes gene_type:complete